MGNYDDNRLALSFSFSSTVPLSMLRNRAHFKYHLANCNSDGERVGFLLDTCVLGIIKQFTCQGGLTHCLVDKCIKHTERVNKMAKNDLKM